MECILFSCQSMYCSSLRTDVLHTVVALGWCSIAMSNIVHMCNCTWHCAWLFFFCFFLHNHLVWIIEGPDNRGPDNRGYTVCQMHTQYRKCTYGTSNAYTVCQIHIQYIKCAYCTSNAHTAHQMRIQYVKFTYSMSNAHTVPQMHIRHIKCVYSMSNSHTVHQMRILYVKCT